MSDSQHGARGCKHIRETNLKQTNRPLFTAFALGVSNNEAGFVVLFFFSFPFNGCLWFDVSRE